MRILMLVLAAVFASVATADEQYQAIVETKAYNFPPPPGSVTKLVHTYKAGDEVKFKYGSPCGSDTCAVITPSGKEAWIYSHKVATAESLSEKSARYQKIGWDKMSKSDLSVWAKIRNQPRSIETCAMMLARDPDYTSDTDWPAYCDTFRDTLEVQNATAEIRNKLAALDLPEKQKQSVIDRHIWIGAPKEAVRLSWGTPKDINRTMTSNRTREQWVYGSGRYVYIENGKVVAVQD